MDRYKTIVEIFEQQGLTRVRDLTMGINKYISGYFGDYRIQYRPETSTEGDSICLSDSNGATIAIFFEAEIKNIPKILKTAKSLTEDE